MILSKAALQASATDSPNPLLTDSTATSLANSSVMYIGRLLTDECTALGNRASLGIDILFLIYNFW